MKSVQVASIRSHLAVALFPRGDPQHLERKSGAKAPLQQKAQLALALPAVCGNRSKPAPPQGQRGCAIAGFEPCGGCGDHIGIDPTPAHLAADSSSASAASLRMDQLRGKALLGEPTSRLQFIQNRGNEGRIGATATKKLLHLAA
jgi:hypothetical protein